MLLKPWMTVLVYLAFAGFGWVVFRLSCRRDYLKAGKLSGLSTALELVVFAVHGMISYLYMEIPFPELMPPLEPRPVLNSAAFVLIVAGITGVLASMTHLGYGATMGGHSGSVRQSGMYAITRNPQIIFYTLVIVGYSLLWPNWLAAVWVLAYLFVAHMMVITEEEYLLATYGDEYKVYMQEAPRYLFRLG